MVKAACIALAEDFPEGGGVLAGALGVEVFPAAVFGAALAAALV